MKDWGTRQGSRTIVRVRLPRLSPRAYQRITLLALIALVFIIVTGAAVRLTGSGLGCSDWPTCESNQIVAPLEYHAMIEFINRTITGLVSVMVMLAVLGSLVRTPRRRDLTWLSLGLVAGVIGQIVLGGLTVLFELRPPFVIAHFLLSMVLVWNAVVLHHRAGHDGQPGLLGLRSGDLQRRGERLRLRTPCGLWRRHLRDADAVDDPEPPLPGLRRRHLLDDGERRGLQRLDLLPGRLPRGLHRHGQGEPGLRILPGGQLFDDGRRGGVQQEGTARDTRRPCAQPDPCWTGPRCRWRGQVKRRTAHHLRE
jgi:hypothetical protein